MLLNQKFLGPIAPAIIKLGDKKKGMCLRGREVGEREEGKERGREEECKACGGG